MAKTKNFIEALDAKLAADPELAGQVDQESLNVEIAQQVQILREEFGLTQKELAQKIGTSQSVISRIEDADYDGHSLSLLRRIADALGKKLCVKFCSEEQKRHLLSASTGSEVKIIVRSIAGQQMTTQRGLYNSDVYGQAQEISMANVSVGAAFVGPSHLLAISE